MNIIYCIYLYTEYIYIYDIYIYIYYVHIFIYLFIAFYVLMCIETAYIDSSYIITIWASGATCTGRDSLMKKEKFL